MSLAEELAKKHFDHDSSVDYSSWDAESRARAAINEAIERCAEVCDKKAKEYFDMALDSGEDSACGHCAEDIRALKG